MACFGRSSNGAVVLCCISSPFGELSTTRGEMIYVLLTRAPLYRGRSPFSCDLHVLGAPLTFVLSQDQTLQLNFALSIRGPTEDLILGELPYRSSEVDLTCEFVRIWKVSSARALEMRDNGIEPSGSPL